MEKMIKSDAFLYETHLHTSQSSKCASADAKTQVEFYKNLGYTGIIVTDHFLNGNTNVPKDLSWKERIDQFCLSYEIAVLEGNKIGLDVFFGWEFSYNGTDLLTYGLDKSWLLLHENIDRLRINEYCDLVHQYGGLIVHAHPFREASYIDYIRLFPSRTDAVEVYNANRSDFENKQALDYANSYGLKQSSGSDNHTGFQKFYGGVSSPNRFNSINDFITFILSGEASLLKIDE